MLVTERQFQEILVVVDDEMVEVLRLMHSLGDNPNNPTGLKIKMIKALRCMSSMTGSKYGLKECKEFVEAEWPSLVRW